MGARVIHLAEIRSRRGLQSRDAMPAPSAPISDHFHFWGGASGRRYVHTVHSLIECPELADANFILVRREANGSRRVLAIGHTVHQSASLNLAEIRLRGARLGANEVHIHLLAKSQPERRLIELDLRAAQPAAAEARLGGTRH